MLNNSEALWTALAALKFRPLIFRLRGFTWKDRGGGVEEGESLSSTERAEMEGLLGCDFSDVRIYDSQQAGEIARQLSAEAFTAGNKIFSAEGKLDTATSAGKALLAHELTHVAQHKQQTVERPLPYGGAIHGDARHDTEQVATSSFTRASGSLMQQAMEAEAQAMERLVREADETTPSQAERSSHERMGIDAEDIADRVYRLMRDELILEKERARA